MTCLACRCSPQRHRHAHYPQVLPTLNVDPVGALTSPLTSAELLAVSRAATAAKLGLQEAPSRAPTMPRTEVKVAQTASPPPLLSSAGAFRVDRVVCVCVRVFEHRLRHIRVLHTAAMAARSCVEAAHGIASSDVVGEEEVLYLLYLLYRQRRSSRGRECSRCPCTGHTLRMHACTGNALRMRT